MVIHHTCSLHKCINDCRTNKFKSYFFQILADFIRKRCCNWYILHLFPMISNWSIIYISPYKFIKTSILFLYLQKGFAIRYSCRHLKAVSNNSFICQQFLNFFFIVKRYFNRIKTIKRFSKCLSFLSTVIQLSPACIPSKISISKSLLSSCTGRPHSWS